MRIRLCCGVEGSEPFYEDVTGMALEELPHGGRHGMGRRTEA